MLSQIYIEKSNGLSTVPALEVIVWYDNHFSEDEKEHLMFLYPDIEFCFEANEEK